MRQEDAHRHQLAAVLHHGKRRPDGRAAREARDRVEHHREESQQREPDEQHTREMTAALVAETPSDREGEQTEGVERPKNDELANLVRGIEPAL